MATTVDPQDGLFDSGVIELLSAQSDVAMLDAVATRDATGEEYALFVVNRSLTHRVDAPVTLTLPPGVTGTVTVLNGPSFSSRNDAANPTRVSPSTASFAATGNFTYPFPPHSLTVFRWTK